MQAAVPDDHADRPAVVEDINGRLRGLFTGVSNVDVIAQAMGDSFALDTVEHEGVGGTSGQMPLKVILDEIQVKERLVKAKLGMWSPMADHQASMFRSLNVVIGRNGSGYTLWAHVSDSVHYPARAAENIRMILVKVFADAGNVTVSDTPMGTARASASASASFA